MSKKYNISTKGTTCKKCGKALLPRRRATKLCSQCWREEQNGRVLPLCIICGKKLSAVKNTTGRCKKCSGKVFVPWNKGVKGLVPWNKGKSNFKTKE